jgi:predicted nucleotidyltransferase
MYYIEERHLKIIQDILKKYPYRFYIFGSRSRGDNKKFSDLDLGYTSNVDWKTLIKLEEEFEESDIPYKVDLVNLDKSSAEFRESIKDDLQEFI